jgi:O-antigen/teichoic acid export membrane protein
LGVEYQFKVSNIAYRVAKPVLTRAERMGDLREIRTRLLRVNTTLIFPLLALLIVLAPDVVPWVYGSDWSGAVEPAQVLAVAGIWTILLAGIDAPLMAVGRPGALAIFNVAMMLGAGMTAWFTAPMGITAVAVGIPYASSCSCSPASSSCSGALSVFRCARASVRVPPHWCVQASSCWQPCRPPMPSVRCWMRFRSRC